MSTLQERLADLADGAVAGPPPEGLWEHGHRLHRRRRAGTVAIVAAAAVLLAALAGLDRSRGPVVDVEPAGPTTRLGLPDRLFDPHPRLAGTADTGPIGPLSVVGSATREDGSGEPSDALVGVSATGEYAFLDLPGLRTTDAFRTVPFFALSADGTRLAYWLPGEPAGEPGGGDPDAESYVGVAVYDTVTGERWDRPIDTEHGVVPTAFRWADDTLWFGVWQYEARRTDRWVSILENVVSWEPRSGRGVVLDGRDQAQTAALGNESVHDGDLVRVDRDRRLQLVGPDGEVTTQGQLRSAPDGPVFISPDGSRLAGLLRTGGDDTVTDLPDPVVVGSLVTSTSVVLNEIPEAGTRGLEVLLGWRDDTHVVGLRSRGRESYQGVVSIDVDTGALEQLLPFDTNLTAQLHRLALAEDALAGPVFEATPPPEPRERRGTIGAGAAVVLVCGLAVLWWRRRVQR